MKIRKIISLFTIIAILLSTISVFNVTTYAAETEKKILTYTPKGNDFCNYYFNYYVNDDGKTVTIVDIIVYDFDDTSYGYDYLYIPEKFGKYEVSAIEKTSSWSSSEVAISNNNKYFKIVDDVLYDYDMTTLISYASNKSDSKFVVPKSVKHIASYAFNSYNVSTELKSIILNEGLLTIGDGAFYMSRITSFSIPKSVTKIGKNALNTFEISKLKIHEDNKYYTMKNGNLLSKDLKTLIWYPNLESKKSYTIPKTVVTVAEEALDCSTRYVNILKISENVKSLSNFGTAYLKSIIVDAKNKYFKSVDNVLYTKDMKKLVCYPALREGRSFIVPENVEILGEGCFSLSYNINRITLPKGLKTIEAYAFSVCSVTQISIPKGVTKIPEGCFILSDLESITFESKKMIIGDSAFFYCMRLKSITLPNKTTKIGANAFRECHRLTSIIIPSSVKYIGKSAFSPEYISRIKVTKGSYAEKYVDKYYPEIKVVV